MSTPQAPAKSAPQGGQTPNAPVLAPWSFPVGVLGTENQSDYQNSLTFTAAVQNFPDVKVQPDGWLRGMWFDVAGVSAGNSATVAFQPDAPFAAIDTVLFRDTGGEQIFGPFNGYDWMTTNKFGAYHAQGDPRADNQFTAITGSGGSGGTFHMSLYLPLEIAAADALGDVENRSENSIYRVSITLAASATVYSTAPTVAPVVTVTTTQDSYTEPVAAMSLGGRSVSTAPPSPGTLQYWKQEQVAVPAAAFSALITNGIGNGYRNVIFKLVRNAGTRANGDADFPDPFEVTLGTTRTRLYKKATWKDKTQRHFEFVGTTNDSALNLENGVFPMIFTQDVGIKPGDEARRRYQRTKTGNTYKTRGTYANAGLLSITSNYIVPRGNDFSQVVA